MRFVQLAVLACALTMGVLTPAVLRAQIPSLGSMIPDRTKLLEQATNLVKELTAMKQDPKLSAADKTKVDEMLPKATDLTSELKKPQTEPNKLVQLGSQLGDLQKQF